MNKESLKIYLFYCSNSLDAEELSLIYEQHSVELKPIPLPCSGKIDILYLTKAFETGADGVAVVTCKLGECKYLEGNMRAGKRVIAVNELLKEIGLSRDQLIILEKTTSGIEPIIRGIGNFITDIKSLSRENMKSHSKIPVS